MTSTTSNTPAESPAERDRRQRKRVGFDSIAAQYDEIRPTYPPCLVTSMLDIAGARAGAPVLEVGCGTGQLTRDLSAHDIALTAIDPGPSMIAIARTHTRSADVRFEVTTFEDFDARGGSRRLIVSAAAFHWVDPDVWWTKSHTLLEDDGWLAVLDSDTQYDEPLQSALHELWVRHSETGAAWATAPRVTMRDRFESSGYFTNVRHAAHVESQRQAPRQIQALMETTATWLAYTQATREAFRADLNHVLSQHREHVGATHTSSLWMGQRRPSQREATR